MDVGELHLIVRIEFIGVDQERYTSYLDRQHMSWGADCRRHMSSLWSRCCKAEQQEDMYDS
jgi:hypothetical protein